MSFYHELFSAKQESEPDEILRFVQTKVTEEMNDDLSKPFTANEIEGPFYDGSE
jgi:hypothetical protein